MGIRAERGGAVPCTWRQCCPTGIRAWWPDTAREAFVWMLFAGEGTAQGAAHSGNIAQEAFGHCGPILPGRHLHGVFVWNVAAWSVAYHGNTAQEAFGHSGPILPRKHWRWVFTLNVAAQVVCTWRQYCPRGIWARRSDTAREAFAVGVRAVGGCAGAAPSGNIAQEAFGPGGPILPRRHLHSHCSLRQPCHSRISALGIVRAAMMLLCFAWVL